MGKDKKQNKKETSSLVTKESVCATVGIFAIAMLFILCTRSLVFGDFGVAIHGFLTGVFGYCAYPLVALVIYLCVAGLFGKRFIKDRWLAFNIAVAGYFLVLIIHTATTFKWPLEGYLKACFKSGEALSTITPGGWLAGVVVYGVSKVATQLGALIFFILLCCLSISICVKVAKRDKKEIKPKAKKPTKEQNVESAKPIKTVEIPLSQTPAGQPVTPQMQGQPQPVVGQAQAMQYPYANAVAQTQVPAGEPVVEMVDTTQSQMAQPMVNGYAIPAVPQRPGVSLADSVPNTTQPQVSTEPTFHSPFGNAQTMPIIDRAMFVPETRETVTQKNEYDYSNPKDFLFGGSPAENYRRNLLFDPNARVNNLPVQEKTNAVGGTSGFMPSYSDAYQNSMNHNTYAAEKTVSSFNFQTAQSTARDTVEPQSYFDLQSERERMSMDTRAQTVEPMQPLSSEPQREENSPYTLFSGSSRTENVETRVERDENVLGRGEDVFGRVSDLSTRNDGETEYKRHDYMSLFSPSNPNLFGDVDDSLETRLSDVADRSFTTSRDNNERFDTFERETLAREEQEDRDGFSLLDDDPYALRSDFSRMETERDSNVAFDVSKSDDRTEDVLSSSRMGFGRDEEEDRITLDGDRDIVASTRMEEPIIPVAVEQPKPVAPPKPVESPKPVELPKPRVIKPYVRPRLDDFDCRDIEPVSNAAEVEETKEMIVSTLDEFSVRGASIDTVTFGPTVARYNVMIPRNIQPKKVVALDQSIAIGLRSNGVNVYPNYEDGAVSIEVPNKNRQFVQLGCMLSGDTFVNAKPSSLMFAMGKDVANRKVYGDISKMIHMLVAGSSGSGKSVFLGALIISLIYKYSPEELRLILIDPKKTEFVLYNDLPHLMVNEIITDAHKAIQSLNWAIMEMNRRYGLFEQMSRSGAYVVSLDQYNAQVAQNERLPKIVIVIDELADLMLAAKKEMEDRIQNLTQKARAAGIHLIVATQRPSTDVITGVIKSNLATRIAFYVATDVDSRVILDQSGAQKLLGKGDLLYTMPGVAAPIRVQSAFISPEESQRIVNFIKNNNTAYYDEEATAFINSRGGYAGGDEASGGGARDGENIDPVYIEALRHVIACGSASISMIQRKCAAGYSRAGKIVEWMEEMGYISSFDGSKARKVLITKEEFESKYGSLE